MCLQANGWFVFVPLGCTFGLLKKKNESIKKKKKWECASTEACLCSVACSMAGG